MRGGEIPWAFSCSALLTLLCCFRGDENPRAVRCSSPILTLLSCMRGMRSFGLSAALLLLLASHHLSQRLPNRYSILYSKCSMLYSRYSRLYVHTPGNLECTTCVLCCNPGVLDGTIGVLKCTPGV